MSGESAVALSRHGLPALAAPWPLAAALPPGRLLRQEGLDGIPETVGARNGFFMDP